MDLGNDNLQSKSNLKYFEESGKKINHPSFGRVEETCNMPMETLIETYEPDERPSKIGKIENVNFDSV
tara:strand:- start:120 stop:323 length:204 start_codon:yes stop_codon:yes gene_type:complete